MSIIKVVCMYCHAFIRNKDSEGMTGTSHGVCAICRTLPESELQTIHRQTLEMETAANQDSR